MDRRIFLAAGGLGALLVGGALLFMDSDEDEIRALLAELAAAASMPENRGNPAFFALGMKAKLAEILAPGARLTAPELQSAAGIDEIVGAALRYGEQYQKVDVSFVDVRFARLDKAGATVNARVALSAVGGGGPRREERDVTIEVTKLDGDWRVVSIEASPKP